MLIFWIFSILTTVTHQCAPHGPSSWTKVQNHHHHHQTVENFYFDNRTIYNKIQEIEKRIDKIEEKTEVKNPENPKIEVPENPNSENSEVPEKADCLSCSSKPKILENCEKCVPIEISDPIDYYSCKAIEVKCQSGARKFKISEDHEKMILDPNMVFRLDCAKGSWVLNVGSVEQKVDQISCLTI